MPPLLKSASLKTDVSIKDLDEEGDDDEERDEDEWETIELGDKRISIRTSVLEEKATACHMLYCYAEELKEGFYPYVEVSTTHKQRNNQGCRQPFAGTWTKLRVKPKPDVGPLASGYTKLYLLFCLW